MKITEQLDEENSEMKIGDYRYVISAWDNSLEFYKTNQKWKKVFFDDYGLSEYKLLKFHSMDNGNYIMWDESTGGLYSSKRWRLFKTESEAIDYCKKANNHKLKSLRKFITGNGFII